MIPAWLHPVRDAARRITVHDLTRFQPPEGTETRHGAVLLLFGEGPEGPDLLLTERAHTMRSHPGQVSFPGGGVDPGETAHEAALREAWEETGLDPAGVEVFGDLPDLWLPYSNFRVTPVLGWWHAPSPVTNRSEEEVHAVHQVPIAELVEPTYRCSVRAPSGYVGPAFLIGPDHEVILWGFTAGIISRLFEYVGWSRPWDPGVVRPLPAYMLQADPPDLGTTSPNPAPNTDFREGPGR